MSREKEMKNIKLKAVQIFEALGYTVETNRYFGDHIVDIFIKREKIIGSEYESWVCLVSKGNQKVGKDDIRRLFHMWEAVRKELAKESNLYSDCQAMYISGNGFTGGAINMAKEKWIELTTPAHLHDDQVKFIKKCEEFHQEFVDVVMMGIMAKTIFKNSEEMTGFLEEIRSNKYLENIKNGDKKM